MHVHAGQGRHREATLVLEKGSEFDPLNGQMRLQLEVATQGVLRDLVEGLHMIPCCAVHCSVQLPKFTKTCY